ncbi:hypothetical protein AB0F72_02810 [Actinoplanes sp. NPDC023936]|uniref:hypothetical protein n=1 Tax=Actinoplanes sp. NPDC023936 TaxID=3154910 RepID=UPI0033DA46DE
MKRIDLVVPAASIAGLRIPPLAITTGTPDPQWVEVPLSRWRLGKLRPAGTFPLDARSARSVRRAVRVAPWSVLAALVLLIVWSVVVALEAYVSFPGLLTVLAAASLSISVLSLVRDRGVPKHLPYRTRFGDLRIPHVPVEVAQQWVALNPGVLAADEPAPRPHSRRFYVGWSVGLLTASAGLAVVLANNGREDSVLLWMLLPVLFVVGVVAALKIPSPGTGVGVRTWPPVNVDRRTP